MVVRIVWTLAGSSVRADGGPQSSCEQDETFAWVCCFESLYEARDSFLDLAPIEESHPDVVMTERRTDRGSLIARSTRPSGKRNRIGPSRASRNCGTSCALSSGESSRAACAALYQTTGFRNVRGMPIRARNTSSGSRAAILTR